MSDRVEELMSQAWEMEDTPEKVAILEEAVREADALSNIPMAYEVRMELIEAAAYSGFHERAIVAFSWCIARFDETPDEYDESAVLWKYKWILDVLPEFHAVSKQQIVSMQDDMAKRYETMGYSLRPVHYMRFSNAMRMGDLDEALEHFKRWKRSKRDWMADCRACEREKQTELFARLRRDEEALKSAKPILEGNMSCTEIPHLTYGTIIRPLLRLNKREDAREAHRTGYRMISTNAMYLRGIAEHLLLLAAIGDLEKAVRLFEKHLPWAAETANPHARFCFYASSAQFLNALDRSREGLRKLTLPARLPCVQQGSEYDPAELAKWFDKESQHIAQQFNHRNGNDYYDLVLNENRQLAGLA